VRPPIQHPGDDPAGEIAETHVKLCTEGIIGPGLLVGSGNALHNGGPAGVLIRFSLVGIIVFFVMHGTPLKTKTSDLETELFASRQSLGEMATVVPVTGSFVEYAQRFLDDSVAFSLGWAYWYLWVTVTSPP
jgi:amino acid transporter